MPSKEEKERLRQEAAMPVAKKEEMPNYNIENIQLIDALDAVRKRPAMYIGGTDSRGVHQLFLEICDNAVDEALAGACDRIEVALHKDGSLSVQDNGPGFDTHIQAHNGLSLLEDVFTALRYSRTSKRDRYHVCGGSHGVGIFPVSALSEWAKVRTRNEVGAFAAEFARGNLVLPLHTLEDATLAGRGTQVSLKPDRLIFGNAGFTPERIAQRLWEIAFLLPNLTLVFTNEHSLSVEPVVYHCPDGLRELVGYLNHGRSVLHEVVGFHSEIGGVVVDGAFQYCADSDPLLRTFANVTPTAEGQHETAFFAGLTRALNHSARIFSPDIVLPQPLRRKQSQKGLTAVIGVLVKRPQFGSATRLRLDNAEVYGPVLRTVYQAARAAFEADLDAARRINGYLHTQAT